MLIVVDIRIVGLWEMCMMTLIISRIGVVVSSIGVVVASVRVWAVWTTFPSITFFNRLIVGAGIRVNLSIRTSKIPICQTKLIGNWEVVGKRFFLRVEFPCTQWIR